MKRNPTALRSSREDWEDFLQHGLASSTVGKVRLLHASYSLSSENLPSLKNTPKNCPDTSLETTTQEEGPASDNQPYLPCPPPPPIVYNPLGTAMTFGAGRLWRPARKPQAWALSLCKHLPSRGNGISSVTRVIPGISCGVGETHNCWTYQLPPAWAFRKCFLCTQVYGSSQFV